MDSKVHDEVGHWPGKIITDLKLVRQLSEDTTIEEARELRLAERIQEALKDGWTPGSGLSAVQIGVLKRYGWYKLKDQEPVELVNPVIVSAKGGYVYNGEGCMSIPKKRWNVYRFNTISFVNHDQGAKGRMMTVDGFEAVIVQHEVDHMAGLLCCDVHGPQKQGRNEPCQCGSGMKFKKCCG